MRVKFFPQGNKAVHKERIGGDCMLFRKCYV